MHKVVIVEDEEIIRKGLIYSTNWLELGFTIVGEASNGKTGLELIKSLSPDVVITDIKMPYLSGLEMLSKLQDDKSLDFISIVLSSYSEFEYARQSISLGVCEYLLKPVDDEQLREVLTKLDNVLKQKNVITPPQPQNSFIDFTIQEYKNPYVTQAIDFISEHYQEKLSLESTAEVLQISVTYLNKKLKEETGLTFLELLNRYRITKSVEFLKDGTYKIYEISELSGFTDYRHFCNVFKKYTGTIPSSFLKSNS